RRESRSSCEATVKEAAAEYFHSKPSQNSSLVSKFNSKCAKCRVTFRLVMPQKSYTLHLILVLCNTPYNTSLSYPIISLSKPVTSLFQIYISSNTNYLTVFSLLCHSLDLWGLLLLWLTCLTLFPKIPSCLFNQISL
ncbi:hypothetical protein VIGAN_07084100, partial [Vigna angularis var. angularis]